MQALLAEYRRSLKMREAEELLDYYFYRPVGFLFVKSVYRLPITPNGVTVLSLIAGLIAAWSIAGSSFVAAAVWYAAANILDCSDGQLARLQKSGTPLGRLVDGVADYVSSVAIFVACGVSLARGTPLAWWLVVAGGISSAIHAFYFDFYQGEYIATIRGETNVTERELERFSRQNPTRGWGSAFFIRLYVRYLALQKSSTSERAGVDRERYRGMMRPMIRLWSFLGPTDNRSLLILCALIGRIDAYLWIPATLGNVWLVVCLLRQRGIDRDLARGPAAAAPSAGIGRG